jgi:hypothetical protein
MQIRIPITFVLHKLQPTWADLRFGLERALINEADVVQAAIEWVSQSPDASDSEIELAGLYRNELNRVPELLRELTASSEAIRATIEKKWLFLLLAWLYDQKESIDDPLGKVEEVYADFGYPKEIAGFVRYMPAQDGYRPQDHTREENLNRLFRLWNDYLTACNF